MTMPSAGSESAGDDSVSRYEFRIWAPSLAEVRERLERLSGPQPAAQSRETYIVSDATDDTNAKIRAGTMDIKVLLRTDQNLEQWSPYLKAHFPIDATLIAEKIFPALRVDPPDHLLASRREVFTAEAFVDTVVKSHPRLAAVELGKVRRRYALGVCAAEFVEVEITGRELHSVAVESANPRAVLDAMGKLAIGGYPNISYVRQIKSMLGRA
jgi:hypothetical protein